MVLSRNSRVGYVGYYRHMAGVVIVSWRKSGFVCSGTAITVWEWDYKPL